MMDKIFNIIDLRRILIVCTALCTLLGAEAYATEGEQDYAAEETEVTVLPPLFEYPVVPAEITDWKESSNWIIEHFWDNFDTKQKAVGQSQLNHAFKTFAVPMRFADSKVVYKAVDKLIDRVKKNPSLLLQLTMAAERNIYDPFTSEGMIDEIYLPFLKAVLAQKKLPEIRKARFRAQYESLHGCLVGDVMKNFDFTDTHGNNSLFVPTSVYTVIEFGDPDCSECRILKLRLETDSEIQRSVADGKMQIYFIIPDVDPDEGDSWQELVKDYPHSWVVGAASDLEEKMDLRVTPCLYVVGPDGKIISKNADIDTLKSIIRMPQ